MTKQPLSSGQPLSASSSAASPSTSYATPLPAMSGTPYKMTQEQRVKDLKELLEDDYWRAIHDDVRIVINMYETGQLTDGDVIFVQNGKVHSTRPAPMDGKPIFQERVGHISFMLMQAPLSYGLAPGAV